MLKKYESFIKISKSSECSFYEAIVRQNNQKVLIKRIKQQCSWSQMLSCSSLKIQSKQYYFPKLIQIFKSKGSYFIVYQKPAGHNLTFEIEIPKKQLAEFYQLTLQICKAFSELKNQIKYLYIYPQWIFMHRNSMRICHFQPYFKKEDSYKNSENETHVFMYNIKKKSFSVEPCKNQTGEFERIQNMNFNLGYIAYHLLTGSSTDWEESEEKYFKKIKEIQLNCRLRIFNETKDQKLAHLIEKLLKFEDMDSQMQSYDDLFTQFFEFLKKKSKYFNSQKPIQSHRIIQVTMQKMSIFTKSSIIRSEKKKKSIRPCCVNKTFDEHYNDYESPEDNQYRLIDKHRIQQSKRKSLKRYMEEIEPTNSFSKLKNVEQILNKSHLNRQKINLSCFLPSLSTERKLSGIINNLNSIKSPSPGHKKTMFRSCEKT